MSSLKHQAKSSLIWTVLENVFVKFFTFGVTLVLTRLLSPEDFGLIGLITIFIVVGSGIIDSGLGSSLIRDENSDDLDYSTVFYSNLILSIVIYILIYLVSPLIANYFSQPILVNLIRVYAITLIIGAFINVQQNIIMKELAFKKLTILTLPGVIIGSLLAVIMAYNDYGVWSIVMQQVLSQFIKAITIWFFSGWKPILSFSFKKLKYHLNFGYKLMFSAVLNSIFNELYSVVIGKNFSVTTLGYYTQAKTIKNFPVNFVTVVLSKVSYPLLSKIKNETEKIGQVYRSILRSVFYIVTYIMFSLAVISDSLFFVLFSDKWLPAVPFFQVLVVSSVLTPIHSYNINVFKIFGRTDLFLKLEVIKICLVSATICFGLFFGIYGLLWSIVGASFLGLFINTYYSGDIINYNTKQQFKDIIPVLLIGFIAWGISSFCLGYIDNKYVSIVLGFIVFSVTYLGLSTITKNISFKETIYLLKVFVFNKSNELITKEKNS